MPKKSKFIVIEGSDGVGKKTQADLITKMFRRVGKQVVFYDFPQYERSFFGKMVASYLNGEFGDVDDVSPYLISLLYAGDRFEAAEHIRHDLRRGKIVISNRYTQSNMGFQSAKIKDENEKKKFLQWLEELEYGIFNIPKPDLVIYLYAPHKISQKMVDKKTKRGYTDKKRDIHERNGKFLAKVEKEYLSLAKSSPEWRTIICVVGDKMLTPEEISKRIFAIIEGRSVINDPKATTLF
ncbi:dTMP kinase [Candidatus Berkelbacteria bacterium CG10_big_fil_rev_8_21_14_0_10_41_12]|uniref:Thymidylate kinase n=1 Tax=Candidatus Berkelbacteria bacterium CG10_big_fil_rev_8_21_14_0_10_41_12 TaxID=1974513 RepID=A0A2M6WXX4_9BACT|nr:MAG: dTMP kinase [Candidatus Berkelbacteria bacterium CG10_big_fil_rev_8_21_14_0_10_41_12]